ncbi:MAG: DUF1080 domain-containing protein [Bacteroidota bacterium]
MIFGQNKDKKLPPEATEFWEPVPPKVDPGKTNADPPSDAIVLFNGSDLSMWENVKDGSFPKWKVENNAMIVEKGTGAIQTKQGFGDAQLHIEWKAPEEIVGEGQGRGNSGIFLMGKYELQVLDSYESKTYSNGQAGSIYKQSPPLVNATRAPTEWQTYDIIFKAPKFDKNGMVVSSATITVLHNGVLIQNNFTIKGPTEYIGIPQYKSHPEKLPLSLQDHGNPVSFRNIWIREL